MAADVEMTIWEHLDELRSRMIKVAIAFITATLLSALFAKRGLEILLVPLQGNVPQTIYPTESLVVYFRIALLGGATLSMPVIVYQTIRFILPGLLPHERRYLYFLLPGIALCFAGGVAFAGLVMLPVAIEFMQGFLGMIIENRWTLDNYITFVTRVMFWMGIVFQTPLIIFLLAKLGLVTPKGLGRVRKYAILVNAVIAAIVTPTPDPLNMMIVMLPLCLLYELGILLARFAQVGGKERERDTAVAGS
ncbi:MAG: twin-arginine translocase subunit TatC [Anaerolineae bacterium]